MKKGFIFMSLVAANLFLSRAQQGNVGINTQAPGAALDIKSATNNQDKVLRFTTKPSELADSDGYVFFVGKEDNGAYDLRQISFKKLIEKLHVEVPELRKIIVVNSSEQTFTKRSGNHEVVNLKKVLTNTSDSDFELVDGKAVKIKKTGIYDVNAWIGFEQLPPEEGDVVISLAKKSVGETKFSNYRRAVLSRSNDARTRSELINYSEGTGVGASFAFVEDFKAGDEVLLEVSNVFKEADHDLKLLAGGASLSISRVSKDGSTIKVHD